MDLERHKESVCLCCPNLIRSHQCFCISEDEYGTNMLYRMRSLFGSGKHDQFSAGSSELCRPDISYFNAPSQFGHILCAREGSHVPLRLPLFKAEPCCIGQLDVCMRHLVITFSYALLIRSPWTLYQQECNTFLQGTPESSQPFCRITSNRWTALSILIVGHSLFHSHVTYGIIFILCSHCLKYASSSELTLLAAKEHYFIVY